MRAALTAITLIAGFVTPARAQTPTFSLQRFPLLQIGGNEAEATRFREIRSVIRTRSGRIVVADGATNEVRLFDEAGNHLRTIGGDGGDPEFERLAWVREMAGDSLMAFDFQQPAGFVLDADGNVSRAFNLVVTPEHYMAIPQGIFSDGTVMSLTGPPDVVRDSVVGGYRVDIHFVLVTTTETLGFAEANRRVPERNARGRGRRRLPDRRAARPTGLGVGCDVGVEGVAAIKLHARPAWPP